MNGITSFADQNVLNAIMDFYRDIANNGIVSLVPYGNYLVFIFGIIDLCTSWYLYDGQLKFSVMIQKIIKVGAFFFMVTQWSYLTSIICQSFAFIGYVAGGHSGQEALTLIGNNGGDNFFEPSYILEKCDQVCEPIWTSLDKTSGFQIGRCLMHLICLGLVYLGFYFMTLQLILTTIEFSIFTCLAVVLLPFGCIKYTSFLSQRAISGVFSFGIKMMVMFFLLGIISGMAEKFKANDFSTNSAMLKQGLAYLTLGYLTWKIPGMAASMMNGTPSFGDGITPGSLYNSAKGVANRAGNMVSGAAQTIGSQTAKIGTAIAATKAASMASTTSGGGGGGTITSGGGSTAAAATNRQNDLATQSLGNQVSATYQPGGGSGSGNGSSDNSTAKAANSGSSSGSGSSSKIPFAARVAGNYAKELGITLLMANPIQRGFRKGAENAANTRAQFDRYKKYRATKGGTIIDTVGQRNPSTDPPSLGN